VRATEPVEGLLPVDKPAGPTSHDLVAHVRRSLRSGRAGHAGTLDPFATGLLLVLLGRATRLAEYVSALDKTYVATLRFGATSTTGDPEGEITAVAGTAAPSEAEVRDVLGSFLGEREQVPPAYSAVRVGGERAYRMARGGVAFSLRPRLVRIERLEILEYAHPLLRLRAVTGPGVYVRSLARDLGEALGSGAYLTALRRERIGPFDVEQAIRGAESGAEIAARILPAEAAVEHLPALRLGEGIARALAQGRRLPGVGGVGAGLIRLLAPGGFLGVGAVEAGDLRGIKILYPERASA
jgi:tRNA pseudouridine55 synthase